MQESGNNKGNSWQGVKVAVWSIVLLLTLALFIASIPVRLEHMAANADPRPLTQLGITADQYAGYLVFLDIVVALTHILIAAVIFFRKPGDRMAFFVSITLILNGSVLALSDLAQIAGIGPVMLWVDRLIIFLGLVSSLILLYIFPDGKFVPAGTRILSVIWAGLMLAGIFSQDAEGAFGYWSTPIQFLIVMIFAGIGIYAQVYRYSHVSRPIERQQTKWAILGLIAACIGPILVIANVLSSDTSQAVPNMMYQRVEGSFYTSTIVYDLAAATLFKLASLLFPLSFAIAILRYRLWDIDILIRKTLVYTLLTGSLLLVYLVGILVTQAILELFAPSSTLSLVISTLVTIALFTPLRRRIQSGIDRRFYRSRYDAEKIFEAFTQRLRDQVNPDEISSQLLAVLAGTLQPENTSLWLKSTPGKWKISKMRDE